MSQSESGEGTPGGGAVVEFSRWAAMVARARRLTDLDALLAHPSAEALVQATPAQDLFYAIKQVGLADTQELLALCHPRQLQTFIDLDAWRRDRVDHTRLGPWLEALLSAPADVISRALEGLDPEVWLLVLQPHVRVYDFSLEQVDAFGEDQTVLQSSDNQLLVELLDDESPEGQLCHRLLTHLFKHESPELYRRLLTAVRVEIPAELEEEAYRFRRGRLADLGFVEHQEAALAYAFLDPQRVRAQAPPADPITPSGALAERSSHSLPAPYARAFSDGSFLDRVLARVNHEDALAAMGQQLVALANRILTVDDIDVGDAEAVHASAAHMRAYLSMALEHLSGGDVAAAESWLRGLRLVELHRVGFSLTLELKRRADRMFRQGWLAQPGARMDLLEEADRELLAALRRRRPAWFAEGGPRTFETLADVRAAHHALDLIDTESWLLLEVLGLSPGSVPASITFAALARSAIVHLGLGQGFRCTPVSADAVARFVHAGMEPAPEGDVRVLSGDLRDEVTLYLEGLVTERGAEARALVRERAAQWMNGLQSELGHLPAGASIDVRFVGGLWLTP